MAITAAQLLVKVAADTTDAEKGLKSVGDNAQASQGGIKDFLGSMLGLVAGGAVIGGVTAAFGFLKDQLGEVISAGKQEQETETQTAAVLRSTHGAAGMTAQAIHDLADAYSRTTMFSADTVQSTENLLLTFTNIGKDVFPQATQATLDVAQAMGEDTKSAAIQLGKALNDPEKGMSALQRIGVTFTASQKAAVKQMEATGNMAGAQKIVLAELEREFGGSAKAAGSTFAGQLQIAQNQLEQTKEKIGAALIPMLQSLGAAVLPMVAGAGSKFADALSGIADFVSSKVVPAINAFAPVLSGIATGAQTLASIFLSSLKPGIDAILGQFKGMQGPGLNVHQIIQQIQQAIKQAAPVAERLGKAFGELLVHVAPLIPKAAELIEKFAQFQLKMDGALMPVLQKLLPILGQVAQWIGGQLVDAAKAILPQLEQAAQAAGKFASDLSTRLGPAISNVSNFIVGLLHFIQPIWNAVWPGMQQVIQGVWGVISGIVQVAWSLISGIIKVGLDILGGNWGQAWHDIQDTLSGVWSGIQSIISGAINIVVGLIKSVVGDIVGQFHALADLLVGHSIIPDMLKAIIGHFAALPGQILGFIANLVKSAIAFFMSLNDQAVSLMKKLVTGAISEVQKLPGQLASIGPNIISALVDHLNVGQFIDKLKNMAQNALNGVKSIFHISSPSRAFADIGQNISEGLIQGVQSLDVAKAVSDHIKQALPATKASLGLNISGAASAQGIGAGLSSIAAGNGAAAIAQALSSAAQATSGASGAAGQPAIFQVDGHNLARILMPHIMQNARMAAAIRS